MGVGQMRPHEAPRERIPIMTATTATLRYTISYLRSGSWIFAATGDTANGCFAELPTAVLDFADAGQIGEIEADGQTYCVERIG